MSQQTFSELEYNSKKLVTKKEKFLHEMERVVPWQVLEEIVRPHYPEGTTGRPRMPLSKMLKVYCLQQWFGLSDPGAQEALHDMECMRRFAGFNFHDDAIPDESTILQFRHLLEEHGLTKKMFEAINQLLGEKGLIVKRGTIVDATIIHAPSSTKNKAGKRDPEMSSTKKGKQWHFGMKAHVGADSEYGLVHQVICTTASVHDSQPMEQLLHGKEKAIYGDRAYVDQQKQAKYKAKGVAWRVQNKAPKGQELTENQQRQNKRRSRVRSVGEHMFGVVKNLWGYRKVRYRGIRKNESQIFMLFGLGNIYLMRKVLMPAQPA